MTPAFEIKQRDGIAVVALRGEWNLAHAEELKASLATIKATQPNLALDGRNITSLDTAGAFYVLQLKERFCAAKLNHFSDQQIKLVELVQNRLEDFQGSTPAASLNFIESIGKQGEVLFSRLSGLISFLGETACAALSLVKQPRLVRMRELFVQLERVLVDAIPIVALVTGLIGVVVAYLFSIQLVKYGANIFIVDGVTLSMCRELSPIIVAIIMAGRSGSAFTAQIGTMKLNEEIDAMQTLGLSPQQVLVIPRIVALVLAMPLLVFVGDLVGIAGGMMIVYEYADITPDTFIQRIYTHFPIASFYIGLFKAPVYAFFVALIGCAFGFSVENNARSVGENTTRTVVYSIVLVIILNAAFAVLFAHVGFPGSK